MKVTIERKNNAVYLEAQNEDGIIVKMDGSPEIGGENSGARPMQLILMGLGGCTSMDVLSILKKMRENVKSYNVIVEAERAKEEPKVFTKINIHYILEGIAKRENAEKAIQLSMNKYCSVSKMLEKTAEITYSLELI